MYSRLEISIKFRASGLQILGNLTTDAANYNTFIVRQTHQTVVSS